jgi:hypothetical protein
LAVVKTGGCCIPFDVDTPPLDNKLEDEFMCTKLVASPSMADAVCAVLATSPSPSVDGILAGMDEPLAISLRNRKMISFAFSKSALSCTHSLVFSSS